MNDKLFECFKKAIKDAFREVLADYGLKPVKPERPEELLTIKQVSAMLDVSKSTLQNWKKNEYLCPVKIGRRVFYRKTDIESLTGKEERNERL